MLATQHSKAAHAISGYLDAAEYVSTKIKSEMETLADCSVDIGLHEAILRHNSAKASMEAELAGLHLLSDVAREARMCNQSAIKTALNRFVLAYNEDCYPPGTGDVSEIRLRKVPVVWRESARELSGAVKLCQMRLDLMLRTKKADSPGAGFLASICGIAGDAGQVSIVEPIQ